MLISIPSVKKGGKRKKMYVIRSGVKDKLVISCSWPTMLKESGGEEKKEGKGSWEWSTDQLCAYMIIIKEKENLMSIH